MPDVSRPPVGFYSYQHLLSWLGTPVAYEDRLSWACTCSAIPTLHEAEYLLLECEEHRRTH